MKRKRKMLNILYIVIGVAAVVATATFLFVNQRSFGHLPTGKRLERIKQSWHYKDGEWKNEVAMPQFTGDRVKTLIDFFFGSAPRLRPDTALATVKTNLRALPLDSNLIVWFGHSSYLLQLDGKRILVDPVFVKGSPVGFVNKAFKGTDGYLPADMPDIDYMVVTHDHWDHLDYDTQRQLRQRTQQVVTPLGTGEHFEYWGFDANRITDLDWYEQRQFADGFTFHCMPARHFSGRGLKANQALWGSFVIESPSGKRIYVGGDSGYGPHFAKIGRQFPQLDLAILENGQYNEAWAHIHTLPRELAKEMTDLGARHYITVHHSKFALGRHPWDEPLHNERVAAQAAGVPLTVLTIGQPTPLPQ